MVLNIPFISDTGENILHVQGWSLLWDRVWVSGALFGRWSWKGCLSVTLGNTAHSFFRCPGRQSSNQWSSTQKMVWKGFFPVTLGMNLHTHCAVSPRRQSLSWWCSTQKVVLKRLFLVTPRNTLHVHCSGLLEDRAFGSCDSGRLCSACSLFISSKRQDSLSQYDNTWKMVLKRSFISDTGKDCSASSLFRSFQESVLSWYNSLTWKVVLERPFVSDTREECILHVYFSGLWEKELFGLI